MFAPATPIFAHASAKAGWTAAARVIVEGRNCLHASPKQAFGLFESAPVRGSEAER